MATPVSQHHDHPTVKLKITGESSAPTSADPAPIDRDLSLDLEIHQGETVHHIQGDHQLLADLVKVLDRYLSYQLQAQPQGTFTGSVAIRPLDFLYHRVTVRQGEGIVQVDLSMTQLYDLLEAVEEAKQILPPLETLQQRTRSAPSWYAQPQAIAALLVAGVGLVAAATLLSPRAQEAEQTLSSSTTEITAADLEAANGDPPDLDGEGTEAFTPEETDTAPESQRSRASEESEDVSGDELDLETAATDPDEDSPVAAQISTEADPSAPRPEDPPTLGQSTDDGDGSEEPEEDLIATLRAARQGQQSSLSEAGANLELQLAETWETPEDLETDLRYEVIVDDQGTILAVDPQDEPSIQQQELTPLADLDPATEVDLPADTEAFLVIFAAEDGISITPE